MSSSGRRPTPPSPKTRKPKRSEDIDLSAEIRRLEADIAEHPFPESQRPRQAPAMTRYRGAPREAPKKKKSLTSPRKTEHEHDIALDHTFTLRVLHFGTLDPADSNPTKNNTCRDNARRLKRSSSTISVNISPQTFPDS
ncbi:hypothetical protein H4582DRAFT_2079486 [Lactarius indigo]|nr:hypothetical protein H4582DRAFT_2079486 [Lactarius indigo]